MKNFKRSKTKTSKTKTPEYLLDESFVFVFLTTVHLSCQCGMSIKSVKNLKNEEFQKVESSDLENYDPRISFRGKLSFRFSPDSPSQLPLRNV